MATRPGREGDGVTPKFHNIDEAVIARVRSHVVKMGLLLVKYKHGCEFGLSGSGRAPNPIRIELEQLGIYGRRDHYKWIPIACFEKPRAWRMELLAGLIDTDGSVDEFTSSSKGLADGFAQLIRSFGGKATVRERTVDSPRGLAWRVYWRLSERLPLSRPDKQRAPGKRAVDYRKRVCRTVEPLGLMACGDIEIDDPSHCYITGDNVIVSNSGKTETWMVETATRTTGVIPDCMRDDPDVYKAMRFKMERGAIRTRINCASLTTVMPEILIPKLRWTDWIGTGERGGKMGHYGWIPPSSLLGGSWEKAWSEQYRRLTILHRNPDTQQIDGHSYINFMSNDQHPSKFVAGDLDLAYHDEPPTWAIWKEHQARTMGVGGQMGLGMTWPDDPSFPVGWLYDEIFDKAMKGVPGFAWHNLDTTKNRTLNQEAVREQMADWDAATIEVRIRGGNIRFGGLIHPLFTDRTDLWCFSCGELQYKNKEGLCGTCGEDNLAPFNHVQDFEIRRDWPTFFLLDPHPRKAHMMMWVQVAPDDELWCVAELQVDDDVEVVRDRVEALEKDLGLSICQRLIDPKMGAQATSRREIPWVDEFADWGLRCDLADASPVGRERVNRALKPDSDMRRPRIHVHRSCTQCIYQMGRFSWKEHRASLEMEQHQEPKEKDDDYPAMWRYLLNADPHYNVVSHPPKRLTKARRRNRKRL